MLPDFIKKMKFENYGVGGLEVYSSHTPEGTIYFFSTKNEFILPEHSHSAQWTIVVSGSCTFTANGESKIFSVGETYFIPVNLKNQITLNAGYSEIDYVDDPLYGEI